MILIYDHDERADDTVFVTVSCCLEVAFGLRSCHKVVEII